MKRLLSLLMALAMTASLAACGGSGDTDDTETGAGAETQEPAGSESVVPPVEDLTDVDTSTIPGLEDGVFTVGMECAYAPYNWTQMDDSNGAVPISNVPGAYANGYDVMIAQRICDAYGWDLEIVSSAWDSLTPAVQSGTMDANIAGQSMTADRMAEVDMAGPYYYATIVCVTTKDSKYADATSIADLAGGTCTAQSGTIWYESCLPQIENANLLAPAETAPAMIMQLQTGTVDFICTDMPTAMGAVAKDDNLVILNFSGTDGDFQFATEEERAENVNIGISVQKGNTALKDAINTVLSAMTEDDFNALMDQAIAIQPEV
ncbi:transporter substrate-binding domain-containing protein [uncultured Oscillibacter sp.]|uniref:transporter substrate-binding domain-containing protein n=1 Tax=uncultured Oscillibacter sp. TaxID=876091 RepID=UPI001F9A9BEB|nr:transporter substrate-binding domain-containing protein [uncultured Oscillibacter sp.]HJB32052.1 transporter substrate-binding domain-containing protein [Candidatus Oscillibacter excrementavium]